MGDTVAQRQVQLRGVHHHSAVDSEHRVCGGIAFPAQEPDADIRCAYVHHDGVCPRHKPDADMQYTHKVCKVRQRVVLFGNYQCVHIRGQCPFFIRHSTGERKGGLEHYDNYLGCGGCDRLCADAVFYKALQAVER